MLLESAHTSDASFDPAMVLFKSIVQVDTRPVTDVVAQCRAYSARVTIVPIGCHPIWHKPGNRPCRAEEPPGRFHATDGAQHRVDQIPIAIDRPVQVAPAAIDLEVRASSGGESHPSALSGRVEDWRAGPVECPRLATFPAPSTSHETCGFPALRAPICFMPVLIGPIVLGQLSTTLRTAPDSR